MGKVILFLLIGFVLGAVVVYLLQMKDLERLDEAEKELRQLRRALGESESEHGQRLKEAIATLQADYQKKQDQLKAKYEEKIQQLEAQSQPQTPPSPTAENQAPAPQAPELPPATVPILAADIQYALNPAIALATPTGKACEPPILAQTATPVTPSLLETLTFEPPILAAEIKFAVAVTPILCSEPSGKICEPPILAQTATPVTPSLLETLTFEPPILVAAIKYAEAVPSILCSEPNGKTCEPPILAQPPLT